MSKYTLPKEEKIYDYLVENLDHTSNRNDPHQDRLKHLYALIYYLIKRNENGKKYNRQKALDKVLEKSETVDDKPSISAAISQNLGWSEDEDFDKRFKNKKNYEILERINKKFNLTEHDKQLFENLLKINNSVWAISPGKDGKYWDEFRKEGIIAIGWSRLGPLLDYDSQEEIQKEIKKKYDNYDEDGDKNPENKARSCWYFANEIKKGDIIISKNGSSKELFGIGIVKNKEPYNYDNERESYKNKIDVDWIIEKPQNNPLVLNNLDNQFDYKTVYKYDYKRDLFSNIIKEHPEYEELLNQYILDSIEIEKPDEIDFENPDFDSLFDGLFFPYSNSKNIKNRIKTSLEIGKHLILIGPPGTGKSKLAKNICKSYRKKDDEWKMSTATSDWTTFDTIGGYRMTEEEDLEFTPGVFLDCFIDNDKTWLIIDEINRADIDKAFGSLFSALTGDDIVLPYKIDGENIKLIGDPEQDIKASSTNYIIPESWRIIATMNTFDKASLYEMSYAFMRRFAFIEVDIPNNEDIDTDLIENYIGCWDDIKVKNSDSDLVKDIVIIWKHINNTRPIGPALIKDIYAYLSSNPDDYEGALIQYVYPQFEGVSKTSHKKFINDICGKIDELNKEKLIDFVEDFFRIEIGGHWE